jgi:hypothetical protein
MFKKSRALNASVGLTALLFIVFISATCSSGGGGNNDNPSSSSGPPAVPPGEPDPDVTPNVSSFGAAFQNDLQKVLNINFAASITITGGAPANFDSVLIKMDGSVINGDDKAIDKNRSFAWSKAEDVSSDAFCGKTIRVSYEIYAKGNRPPVQTAYEDVVRELSICGPSSSSAEPSSSSVLSKPLVLAFSEAVRINGTIGVNLNTGTGEGAHIYYDHPGTLRVENAKISDGFLTSNGLCYEVEPFNVETPTKTDDFIPCTEGDNSIDYRADLYYLVRIGNGTEWGTGWFLIQGGIAILQSGSIDIKIWKTN